MMYSGIAIIIIHKTCSYDLAKEQLKYMVASITT